MILDVETIFLQVINHRTIPLLENWQAKLNNYLSCLET